MVSVLATYIWNRGLINNSYNPALAWELGPGVIVTYTSDPVSIANFSEAQVTILGNLAHSCGHPFGFRPLIFRSDRISSVYIVSNVCVMCNV